MAEAEALCQACAALPGLRLRGLMAIPAPSADDADSATRRAPFAAVRQLFEHIRAAHGSSTGFAAFDTLSMGMSADMDAAIAEGATLVRIGSAIFGARHYPSHTATGVSQ